MTYLLLALIVYLLGVPVAWWSEWGAAHKLCDEVSGELSIKANYVEDNQFCIKSANELCFFSWLIVFFGKECN